MKESINDARELTEELKRDGFDVELGENLSGDAMRRAFNRLYDRTKPGAAAPAKAASTSPTLTSSSRFIEGALRM